MLDSRDSGEGTQIRRRRVCETCGHRFTTRERIEEQLIRVVKRGGRKEPFDAAKVRRGLELACRKRPVDEETIRRLTARIEHWAATFGGREVTSEQIGGRIAHELHGIDPVAYVRFVSVYRSFDSVEAFAELLREMEKAERADPEGQRRLFDDDAPGRDGPRARRKP